MATHGVDREALMARLVHIYGQQLFVDGFFNADPHAGNLMVQVRLTAPLVRLAALLPAPTRRFAQRKPTGLLRLCAAPGGWDRCVLPPRGWSLPRGLIVGPLLASYRCATAPRCRSCWTLG